jgi:Icc-related predicted phosphoesterase
MVVPMPTLVAMADTHGYHRNLTVPDGDFLIHAGDLTQRGTLAELEAVADFLRSLPHRHKIIIAGNHDFGFERQPEKAQALFHGLTYLQDAGVTLEGLTFWGSPWQPWFYDWAFNLRRGPALDAKWQHIPPNVDVLLTHGPPMGYGDTVYSGERVGCEDLTRHVLRAQPRLHFFGHIHEDRGEWQLGPSRLINCTTSECELGCTVVTL